MRAQLLFDAQAALGESPVWDSKTESLYWVDILQKRVYRFFDQLTELENPIGFIAPRKNTHLLLGLKTSFVDFELDSAQQTVLAVLAEPAKNRLNDGKCDPSGRLLAGTMDMDEKAPSGSLYSFDGKTVTRLLSGIRISNGLAWSPDSKTFYYIDTPTRAVQAFDYDLASGQIANPRIAICVPETFGYPDGMTSDLAGNLWIAMWGGAQIAKWNPNTSQLLEQIHVPALHTSSCIFGGKDMNELYVASARVGMTESDLTKYPLSGGLFKIITNVTGMPSFEFG
jgi:sugar lactone lactonase YvrE